MINAFHFFKWQVEAGHNPITPTMRFYQPTLPVGQGLLGRYYDNADWQGNPILKQVSLRLDTYFHLTPLERPYSVIWNGWLITPQTGEYEFYLDCVGGCQLWLNEALVYDNQAAMDRPVLRLKRGRQAIKVKFRDDQGGSRIHLYWTTPNNTDLRIIDGTYLKP